MERERTYIVIITAGSNSIDEECANLLDAGKCCCSRSHGDDNRQREDTVLIYGRREDRQGEE